MTHKSFNFTNAYALEISARNWEQRPMVDVIDRSGSMYFQHSMTPEQAREMADHLIASALEAELMCKETIGYEVSHE